MQFRFALLAVAAIFSAIYLPDIGHGFVRDDFDWIERSRLTSAADLVRLFTHQPGFYRPLVSLTFSADYAIWHLNSFGYALTNLLLFVAVAVLVYRLARSLTLPAGAAMLAAGVWAFDIHGPRMALLWISGRTALMLCVCALATAIAVLRQRYRTAGVFCLLALLSKEEAVVLPAIMTAFLAWEHRRDRSHASALRSTWPLWAALSVYAALRINSGAFGPASLPAHYPIVPDLRSFMRNLGEYAVRAGLTSAVVMLVVTFVSPPSAPLEIGERRSIVLGALWTIGFFALTIFAANRSDLYALTPSIGCSLAAAALASCALRVSPARFRLASAGFILAAFLLIGLYRWRDERWVRPAEISTTAVQAIRTDTPTALRGRIVLVDDAAARFGLESAFGTLLPEAVRLFKGADWSAELMREANECPRPSLDAYVFVLRDGRLVRCD